jgi:hypothetical protein
MREMRKRKTKKISKNNKMIKGSATIWQPWRENIAGMVWLSHPFPHVCLCNVFPAE